MPVKILSQPSETPLGKTQQAAHAGNDGAQYQLGFHFLAEKEYAIAYQWFINAAESGNPFAISQLTLMYWDPEINTPRLPERIELRLFLRSLQQCEDETNPQYQILLKQMQDLRLINPNNQQAMQDALRQISHLNEETQTRSFDVIIDHLLIGSQKTQQALKYHEVKDETPDITHHFHEGLRLKAIDLNPAALHHFKIAAQKDNFMGLCAKIEIGIMYATAPLNDHPDAQTYLERAHGARKDLELLANNGDRIAQYYLGEYHLYNLGKQEDLSLAGLWFNASAEQNYLPAQRRLEICFQYGIAVAQDPAKARQHSVTEQLLTKIKSKGRSRNPQDIAENVRHAFLAASYGSLEAKALLQAMHQCWQQGKDCIIDEEGKLCPTKNKPSAQASLFYLRLIKHFGEIREVQCYDLDPFAVSDVARLKTTSKTTALFDRTAQESVLHFPVDVVTYIPAPILGMPEEKEDAPIYPELVEVSEHLSAFEINQLLELVQQGDSNAMYQLGMYHLHMKQYQVAAKWFRNAAEAAVFFATSQLIYMELRQQIPSTNLTPYLELGFLLRDLIHLDDNNAPQYKTIIKLMRDRHFILERQEPELAEDLLLLKQLADRQTRDQGLGTLISYLLTRTKETHQEKTTALCARNEQKQNPGVNDFKKGHSAKEDDLLPAAFSYFKKVTLSQADANRKCFAMMELALISHHLQWPCAPDYLEKARKNLPELEMAAQKGSSEAQYYLGEFYFHHLNGYKRTDFCKGAFWFYQSAQQGTRIATIRLAQCYQYGHGLIQNNEKAEPYSSIPLLFKANSEPLEEKFLGEDSYDPLDYFKNGQSFLVNATEADEKALGEADIVKAARLYSLDALLWLNEHYNELQPATKQLIEAYQLLDLLNQCRMPIPKDIEALKQQADLGKVDAQYQLGIYFRERGQNQEAASWFYLASTSNHPLAGIELVKIHCEEEFSTYKIPVQLTPVVKIYRLLITLASIPLEKEKLYCESLAQVKASFNLFDKQLWPMVEQRLQTYRQSPIERNKIANFADKLVGITHKKNTKKEMAPLKEQPRSVELEKAVHFRLLDLGPLAIVSLQKAEKDPETALYTTIERGIHAAIGHLKFDHSPLVEEFRNNARNAYPALKALADTGNAKARYYLGEYYYCNLAQAQQADSVNAAYYFYLAAEEEPFAAIRMHQCYSASHGVTKDESRAAEYLSRIAHVYKLTDESWSLLSAPEFMNNELNDPKLIASFVRKLVAAIKLGSTEAFEKLQALHENWSKNIPVSLINYEIEPKSIEHFLSKSAQFFLLKTLQCFGEEAEIASFYSADNSPFLEKTIELISSAHDQSVCDLIKLPLRLPTLSVPRIPQCHLPYSSLVTKDQATLVEKARENHVDALQALANGPPSTEIHRLLVEKHHPSFFIIGKLLIKPEVQSLSPYHKKDIDCFLKTIQQCMEAKAEDLALDYLTEASKRGLKEASYELYQYHHKKHETPLAKEFILLAANQGDERAEERCDSLFGYSFKQLQPIYQKFMQCKAFINLDESQQRELDLFKTKLLALHPKPMLSRTKPSLPDVQVLDSIIDAAGSSANLLSAS